MTSFKTLLLSLGRCCLVPPRRVHQFVRSVATHLLARQAPLACCKEHHFFFFYPAVVSWGETSSARRCWDQKRNPPSISRHRNCLRKHARAQLIFQLGLLAGPPNATTSPLQATTVTTKTMSQTKQLARRLSKANRKRVCPGAVSSETPSLFCAKSSLWAAPSSCSFRCAAVRPQCMCRARRIAGND